MDLIRLTPVLLFVLVACDSRLPVGSQDGPDQDAGLSQDASGGDGSVGNDANPGSDAGAGGDGATDSGVPGDAGNSDTGGQDAGPAHPGAVTQGSVETWNGILVNNGVTPFAVDFDGTNHLVVWTDLRGRGLYAARVSPQGVVLDPAGVLLRGGEDPILATGNAAVAFDGTNHLVVYTRSRAGVGSELAALRLTRDLQMLDADPIVISDRASATTPIATYDGTQFVVGWARGSNQSFELYAARVHVNGTVLDPNGRSLGGGGASSNTAKLGCAVANGVTAFVFQTPQDQAGTTVFQTWIRRMNGDGTFAESRPEPIGAATRNTNAPGIASNGSVFLVSWLEAAGASFTRIATRVDLTGGGAADDPLVRMGNAGASNQSAAETKITWSGTDWNIFQTVGNGTSEVTRLSNADPMVIGATTTLPPMSAFHSAVSRNNSDPLWFYFGWVDQRRRLRAYRLAPDLSVIDANPIEILGAATLQRDPEISTGGSHALAVWYEYGDERDWDVKAARIAPDGSSMDPNGITISPEAFSNGTPYLAAAFDGTQHLVAWVDSRNSATTGRDIYAARVDASGNVLDPGGIPVSVLGGDPTGLSVAAIPGGRFIVCSIQRATACARIEPSGQVLDLNGGIEVRSAQSAARTVAVTQVDGTFLVAWARNVDSDSHEVSVRSIDPDTGALGLTETSILDSPGLPSSLGFAGGATDGMLVWETVTGIHTARFALAAYVFTDIDLVEQGSPATKPRIARIGDEWLITWRSWVRRERDSELRYRIRRIDGSFVDDTETHAVEFGATSLPVAALGGNWVGVYTHFVEHTSINNYRARSVRIQP